MDAIPTVTVEALVAHDYAGIARPIGTVYEAEQPYAELLMTVGTVRPVPASPRDRDPKTRRR